MGVMSKHCGDSLIATRRPLSPAVASVAVVLTLDATFFGRGGYGLLVYRAQGRNIHWQEIVTERIRDIEEGLRCPA